MIEIAFRQMDNKLMGLRLDGDALTVGHQDYGNKYYSIRYAFNYQRCIAEYPEVEGKSIWREVVEDILKKKLGALKTIKEKAQYLIDEMVKQGNTALYWQQGGHRPQRIDGNVI